MEQTNGAITARHEAKILDYLERKMPKWIKPDFLTVAGLVSSFAAGISYLFAIKSDETLLLVNLFIFMQWAADSLDGRVAIIRATYRPRYWFYIDHMFDSVSVVFILGGLAASPLTKTSSWTAVLSVMLLILINVFLKVHALKSFHISVGMFGPSEARLGLIAFNFFIYFGGNPNVTVAGQPHSLVDVVGWVVTGVLAVMLIPDVARTIIALNKTDKVEIPITKSEDEDKLGTMD